MIFDESQRGRGIFYSNKNKGLDGTIEPAYMSSIKNQEFKEVNINEEEILEAIDSINHEIISLQNSVDNLTQQNAQLNS